MKLSRKQGFTLIELLVVIAVIGILAAVVIASLNSARTKGQEASIKSNLRNMIAAAELSYDATGNYSGACAAVAPMMTAIQNITGTLPTCYSQTAGNDVYTRWGVTATNAAKDKSFSADASGVVTWDVSNSAGAMTWDAATTLCATAGKKLPALEQLKTLYYTHGTTPTGLTASTFWTSTTAVITPANAYYAHLDTTYAGASSSSLKTTASHRALCVS